MPARLNLSALGRIVLGPVWEARGRERNRLDQGTAHRSIELGPDGIRGPGGISGEDFALLAVHGGRARGGGTTRSECLCES